VAANRLRFTDRREAGRILAQRLLDYAGRSDVVVLALPRGGVPVAYEVARMLHAPLDVFTVRKLGAPGHAELAMGAVASGGITIVDRALIEALDVTPEELRDVVDAESAELARREAAYRDHRVRPHLAGKTLILVDDGLATGASMQAAVLALRRQNPLRIIVAVPVGASDTCGDLRQVADEVVCASVPSEFIAVGVHYVDFRQTTDDEVRQLLNVAEEESRSWSIA
jgi:predicted phosphoribosyltransferase